MSPPYFPRTFPCSGAPFPPRGPSGWFPRFHGTVLRLPAAPPASLRFLRFAVPPPRLGFAPMGARSSAHGPGILPDSQTGLFDGDDRTSQVPGEPRCERALLSDPGKTSALGHCRASVLSSTGAKVSTLAKNFVSRLNHTARSLAVYASQRGLLHRHARLTSAWPASVSGREWLPAGFYRKVSEHLILLSQASPGALHRKLASAPPAGHEENPLRPLVGSNWERSILSTLTVSTGATGCR
jgi:hypothetical protein